MEPEPLKSILEEPMVCTVCGLITLVGDCEPDIDGEGSLGCPDCKCLMKETRPLNGKAS
jgi:hypothetical protein